MEKIVKPESQWQVELSPEAFKVARKHGTERAFSGAFHDSKASGTYVCIGCGLSVFSSAHKFDSGTGWPSYWQPIEGAHVETQVDRGFFMTRTEVHCARCDSHLGHVFDDGPAPTGLRYCINSVAMRFEAGV